MIKEIIVYETSDKKQHETREIAFEHSLDRFREYLDKRIMQGVHDGKLNLSKSESYSIVNYLISNTNDLQGFYSLLTKIMDYEE